MIFPTGGSFFQSALSVVIRIWVTLGPDKSPSLLDSFYYTSFSLWSYVVAVATDRSFVQRRRIHCRML